MKSLLLIFLSSLFVSTISFGQKNAYGIDLGYGMTSINKHSWFPSSHYNTVSIGGTYFYKPLKAPFSFTAGASFLNNISQDKKFGFLNIPIGIEFSIPTKFYVFAGAGLDLKLLTYSSDVFKSRYFDFENNSNKLQLAWHLKAGIGLKCSESVDIRLSYLNINDITDFYTNNQLSPGGVTYVEHLFCSTGILNISLKKTITTREKNK